MAFCVWFRRLYTGPYFPNSYNTRTPPSVTAKARRFCRLRLNGANRTLKALGSLKKGAGAPAARALKSLEEVRARAMEISTHY